MPKTSWTADEVAAKVNKSIAAALKTQRASHVAAVKGATAEIAATSKPEEAKIITFHSKAVIAALKAQPIPE